MKLRLKQRLVGAVVLVTLAVIFLPMLLDGPSHPPSRVTLEPIPAAPGDDFVPRKITLTLPDAGPLEAQPAEPDAPARVVLPSPEPVATAAPTPAPEPAKRPEPVALPDGWVVQVGSFSKPDNAHALRDKLAGMGFPAFADSVDGGSGQQVVRVRVGPVPDRAAADALLARLKAEAKLEGILRQLP